MNNFPKQHRFQIQFVKEGKLLKDAQSLRSRVFFAGLKEDEDRFDKYCDHIVALDTINNSVVGTYRLLLGSVAKKIGGFYSETEFDLKNLKKNCNGEILEMGRACVDPGLLLKESCLYLKLLTVYGKAGSLVFVNGDAELSVA